MSEALLSLLFLIDEYFSVSFYVVFLLILDVVGSSVRDEFEEDFSSYTSSIFSGDFALARFCIVMPPMPYLNFAILLSGERF